MRKISLLFVFLLLIAITGKSAFAAESPIVLFQAFYWNVPAGGTWWNTIAMEAPGLRSAGFNHFWFPPPTKGWGGAYSMGYDLFDNYDLGHYYQKGTVETRFGSLAELQNAAAAAGNVLLDLVTNHMMGGDLVKDPFDGKYRHQSFTYPHGIFEKNPYHFYPDEFPDPYPPLMGQEVNHAHPYMFEGQKEWAWWLKTTVGNVAGFRVDAVKHFSWPLSRDLGHIGMVIGEYWCGIHAIRHWMGYTGNYAFDFPLYYALRGPASALDGAGLLHPKGVSFVGNHDTDGVAQKIRAYGFIMYIAPTPTVFWPHWFSYWGQEPIQRALTARLDYDMSGTHTLYKRTNLIIFGNAGGVFGVFNSYPGWAGGWVQVAPHTTFHAIAWGGADDSRPMPQTSCAHGWVNFWASGEGYAYYVVIPEPATMILLSLGLGFIGLKGLKKKKA